MNNGFRLEISHSSTCYFACKGELYSHFVLFDENAPTVFRGRAGTERFVTYLWFRFRCNCFSCPARALVRADVLTKMIERGLRQQRRRKIKK